MCILDPKEAGHSHDKRLTQGLPDVHYILFALHTSVTNHMRFHKHLNAVRSVNEAIHHLNKVRHYILMTRINELQGEQVPKEHFSLKHRGYNHPRMVDRLRVFVEPDGTVRPHRK